MLAVIGVMYSKIYEGVYNDYATSKDRAEIQRQFQEKCSSITAAEELRNCLKQQIEASTNTRNTQEDLYAQKQMAQWAFWTLVATGAIGVISVAVTGIGIYFVKKTLDANIRAVAAAETAIVVENRPWIRFDPQISSDLTINKDGGYINFEITFKNVGGGPARIVVVDAGEINFFGADPATELRDWIAKYVEALKDSKAEAITVFPEEIYNHSLWARLTREMIDKAPPARDGKKMISPVIIFGIFYRSTIEENSLCYTVSAYMLSKPDKERGVAQALLVEASLPDTKIDGRTLMVERYLGLGRAK